MDVKGLAIVLTMLLFFFNTPSPKVNSITPNNGVNNNTVQVIVNGTNFDQKAAVKLVKEDQEDIIASNVKVLSGEKIACNFDLRDKAVGRWDLVVSNKFVKSDTIPQGFLIGYPTPLVNTVSPQKSDNNSTVLIEIDGKYFRKEAMIILSSRKMDIGASRVKVESETKISCQLNLKKAEPGVYDVKVINDDGKVGILTDGFKIDGTSSPAIKEIKTDINRIEPNKGFNNGMILTAIIGSNFIKDSIVKLSYNGKIDITGMNTKVESPEQITCFFDINGKPEGNYDVEVTSPNGQKAVLHNGFIVESFTPNSLELNKKLKPVYFELDKAEIRPNQTSSLRLDLQSLKEYPKLYILLGGHADERGSIGYNLELSAKRAENIKKYLVEQGIHPGRITIYAYGKEFPLIKGHKESAWRYNRRVDILVWEAPPDREQGIKY